MPRKTSRVNVRDICRPVGRTRSGIEYKGAPQKKVKFSNDTLLTDALNKSIDLAASQAIELEKSITENLDWNLSQPFDKTWISPPSTPKDIPPSTPQDIPHITPLSTILGVSTLPATSTPATALPRRLEFEFGGRGGGRLSW